MVSLQVRRVVEDCIKNVHPIYHIKTLMIKRELAKDPNLATENWDRFLPKFQKKNVKRKKAAIVKKPEYTPFPPPQQPSKVDLQLESGEYFLSQSQKAARKAADKQEQQLQRVQDRQQERLKAFVPPQVSVQFRFRESLWCNVHSASCIGAHCETVVLLGASANTYTCTVYCCSSRQNPVILLSLQSVLVSQQSAVQ